MAQYAPPSDAAKALCQRQVLLVFEDIDRPYLERLADEYGHNSEAVIAAILDKQDQGHAYPKQANPLKRKRSRGDGDGDDDNDEKEDSKDNMEAKINDPHYLDRMRSAEYKDMATKLISQDFPLVSKTTIRHKLLFENGSSVFKTYVAMDSAIRNPDRDHPLWVDKKTATKTLDIYSAAKIHHLLRENLPADHRAALDEFLAARRVRNNRDAEAAAEVAEKTNLDQARVNGEMGECGCCFDDLPLNRMVSCEGDTVHWFCRGCMKREAETKIGLSKYEITCISTDGCTAGFSSKQRDLFLDKKLRIALDRIEAQAALREAGIENLETCPFCPEAMEYPTIEENKEFRCPNPSCETSCRLCRKRTHIPKTCAEAAAEEGHDARHAIEEAMSQAVIRKCNKCENPYVKTDGCNKICCSRCGNLQCYVCRQSVKDYSHFNDKSRGGKDDQCPLFDQTDERHQNEARQAEEEQRSRVLKDNPELTSDALRLKMSPLVAEDERKRLENGVRRGVRVRQDPANNLAQRNGLRRENILQRLAQLEADMGRGPREQGNAQARVDFMNAWHQEQHDALLNGQANVFMNAALAGAQNMARIQHQAVQAHLNAARRLRVGIQQAGRAPQFRPPHLLQQAQALDNLIVPAGHAPIAQNAAHLVPKPPVLHQAAANQRLRDDAQPVRAGAMSPGGLRNNNVFLPLMMQAGLQALNPGNQPPQQGLFSNEWSFLNQAPGEERRRSNPSPPPPGLALDRTGSIPVLQAGNRPAAPANRGQASMNRIRDSRA